MLHDQPTEWPQFIYVHYVQIKLDLRGQQKLRDIKHRKNAAVEPISSVLGIAGKAFHYEMLGT